MKLEKDRLKAKVDNLEYNLRQQEEDAKLEGGSVAELNGQSKAFSKSQLTSAQQQQPVKQSKSEPKGILKMTGEPTPIPKRERFNPALNESYEAVGPHLSNQKTFKGHLMGVTSISYNPKKDIVATASDDTTWKLWSVPNGDLIMSGEGHTDWVGGCDFHPRGNLLATASGDGDVKIWDFVNSCCAQTWKEHGQPVWKVAFHDTGDFLLSCSMDHTIKMWDLNMNKSRFTYRGHVDSVNSIDWQPYT